MCSVTTSATPRGLKGTGDNSLLLLSHAQDRLWSRTLRNVSIFTLILENIVIFSYFFAVVFFFYFICVRFYFLICRSCCVSTSPKSSHHFCLSLVEVFNSHLLVGLACK